MVKVSTNPLSKGNTMLNRDEFQLPNGEMPQISFEVEGQKFNIDMDVEPARFAGFYAYCGPDDEDDGLRFDPSNSEYIDGQIDGHEFIDKGILPAYVQKS